MDLQAMIAKKVMNNAFELVAKWLKEKRVNPSGVDPRYVDMSRCSALIVFVSSNPSGPMGTAARHAIDFHYHGCDGQSKTNCLQDVWLLHTPSTFKNSQILRDYIEKNQVNCHLVSLDENRDIDNAKCIKDKVDDIIKSIEQRKIPLDKVAVDITGGSVSVNIGMLSACMVYGGLQLQIMIIDDQDKDTNGRAKSGARSYPRKIELQYQS